ncbi:DUF1549 domain-containing protein [Stieleria varia]|uniref:Bacterial Ig-like domain (Group 2) n=1 Tax=Stieleria varia TaxID=2528005 RepID=A0A5C6A5E3_9BACT|nr:DUF1549 domain-containing protein [Stieleria varia]TWT94605.1 Bacterial Ig-like domain (group 2) [Stieleria varia]
MLPTAHRTTRQWNALKLMAALLALLTVSTCRSTSVLAADQLPSMIIENETVFAFTELVGVDARLQLVVSTVDDAGNQVDVTRAVTYTSEPPGIVSIDETGLVTPLADANVSVTTTHPDGRAVQIPLTVSQTGVAREISFASQVVPIFTKLGCNGGGCHGKIAGQNGFRLSLLGFEPHVDHKHLIAHSLGRRVSVAAPDRSLLLQKSIGTVPHGGGQRMDADSYEYRLLRRWILQGMPYGDENQRVVESIDVFPPHRRVAAGSSQQLSVIATYTDGTREDITRGVVYESNDPQMASVTPTGWVEIGDVVGDVAVMARYQGHVAVFQADVPRTMSPLSLAETHETPSNVIDQHVWNKLNSLGIPRSPRCDDATYVRRATLDIAGRLPTPDEAKAFVADTTADKRERLVNRLLEDEDYAEYFARKWSAILRNQRDSGPLQLRNMLFHQWLTQQFRENVAYDMWVRQLVAARGSITSNPAVSWLDQVSDRNERVEDISQLFLGQRVQCARCHHHPYEKWSQADYSQLMAFFTLIDKKDAGDVAEPVFVSRIGTAATNHPKTGASLKPVGLDGPPIEIAPDEDPREALADWMTQDDNPFFAKSLVNRYWKHFLGRALVEPEDDMRVTNPPSNPALMDALADSFTQSGFDLCELIRTICLSDTYQASSQPLDENLADRRSHSRFYPKRLTAEVLLDGIDHVTGTPSSFAGMPAGTRAVALPDTGFDSYFLDVFGQPQAKTACECERSQDASLAQSLHLLNSKQMQDKLGSDHGRAKRLANDSEATVAVRLDGLYWTTLSRAPTDEELNASLEYLSGRENESAAWEDLIWALVNSKEFLFNH